MVFLNLNKEIKNLIPKRGLLVSIMIGLISVLIIACGGDDEEETTITEVTNQSSTTEETVEETSSDMMYEKEGKSIVEIAVEDGRFTTLVAALQAAELDGVLSGEGSFTVFAPTDDAFGKLPEGTIAGLLEDIPTLKDILLYHVVSGNVFASDVLNLDSAETLQGDTFAIKVMEGKVMVNDSEVIITDIEANNGVIHVIDAVLLPTG